MEAAQIGTGLTFAAGQPLCYEYSRERAGDESCKTEPWRFVVYRGDARRIVGAAFGTAFRLLNPEQPAGGAGEQAQRERVWQAPVWIALGMRPDPKMPEWEELVAFGSAVQNMHLMAGALGLASKWTSGAAATHPHVAEVVGFAPETQLRGFFYSYEQNY